FGLCAIALCLCEWRKWQRGLWVALAMAPSAILMVSELFEEKGEKAYLKAEKFAATWRDFPTLVKEFPGRVLEIIPGPLDMVVLTVLAATALGLFVWHRLRPDEEDPVTRKQVRVVTWLLVAAYLLLPYEIQKPMWWWSLSQRMPALLAAVLLLLP